MMQVNPEKGEYQNLKNKFINSFLKKIKTKLLKFLWK